MSIFKRLRNRWVSWPVLAMALSAFLFAPGVVYAQALSWQINGSQKTAAENTHELNTLKGGMVYVDNNLAAAITKIPSKYIQGNTIFNQPWGSTMVFAKYEPNTATGVIYVIRSLRLPNQDGVIETAQFKPQDFAGLAQDFKVGGGAACTKVNPFWQFQASPGSYEYNHGWFEHMQLPAFETAVGLVMQHMSAVKGWIAIAKTHVKQWTTSSGGLFTTTTTQHLQANTKPQWVAATPSGMGVGQDMGFRAPIPNSTPSSVNMCMGNSPTNFGSASSATLNGRTVGALKLIAGVNFINQGAYTTLPTGSFQSFYHQVSQTGFTGFFFMSVMAVLTAVTAGAGAYLAPALTQTLTASLGFGTGLGVVGTAGVGAAAGALTSMSYNMVSTGSLWLWNKQKNVVGGYPSTGGSATTRNIQQINVQQMLQTAYGQNLQTATTTSGHASNPLSQNGQWDPYPSVAKKVDQQWTPAGFTQQHHIATPSNTKMQTQQPLSLMKQANGGNLNFNSSPYGTLSP